MRIKRKNVIKGEEGFYVVTREGRRIEPQNYKLKSDAEERGTILHEMIKEWDARNVGSVAIVYTSVPHKIY